MDFFKDLAYSLLVLSAARKDNQELVRQDRTSMPGAAAPGKYSVDPAEITLPPTPAVLDSVCSVYSEVRECRTTLYSFLRASFSEFDLRRR